MAVDVNQLLARVQALEQKTKQTPSWRGAWITGVLYYLNDLVTYNDRVYIALASGFGKQPDTQTTYWQAINDSITPRATTNYLVNGSFEDNGVSVSSTAVFNAWTPVAPGWMQYKAGAGDTITAAPTQSGIDPVRGGLWSLQVNRTGTAGGYFCTQWVRPRIGSALCNRVTTLTINVWCTAVGMAQPCYYNPGTSTWVFGPTNKLVNTWETISMPVSGLTTPNSAFGVYLPAGVATGTVYLDNASVTDGPTPPLVVAPLAPTNNGNAVIGNYAPKCVKSFGANFTSVTNPALVVMPFTVAEVDTDNMGLVANYITIKTPGRYAVWGALMTYGGTSTNMNTRCEIVRVAGPGSNIMRGSVYAYDPGVVVNNAQTYVSPRNFYLEDFETGEQIMMYGYVDQPAGATVNIHYVGSYLAASRVGD